MIRVETPESMKLAFALSYLAMHDLDIQDGYVVREDRNALTPYDIRVSRELLQRCKVQFEEQDEGE